MKTPRSFVAHRSFSNIKSGRIPAINCHSPALFPRKPKMPPKVNSLVFKLTEYCNLGCSYCYRDNDREKPRVVMPDEIIHESLQKFAKHIAKTRPDNKHAYTIWHGGEPLLAGIEKFKRIIDLQTRITRESGVIFTNATQTNGVMFDEEWAQFFKTNDFLVGFSLDGPQHVHDIHRKNKGGNSTFNKTLNAIETSLKYGIPTNIIAVITNESSGHANDIYSFLKNSGIKQADLIPCFDYDGPLTLKPEKYAAFMLEIAALWKNDGFQPLNFRFLGDIRKRLFQKQTNSGRIAIGCELAGQCGRNWSLSGRGDVCACECLTPVPRFFLGNIMNMDFEELNSVQGMKEVNDSLKDIDHKCLKCPVFDICHAGCINRRLKEFNLNGKLDLYCEARKSIIDFFQKETSACQAM